MPMDLGRNFTWALEIEGFGFDYQDETYLLTSHTPGAWDTDARAIHCLAAVPKTVVVKTDFRRGATSGGEAVFTLALDRAADRGDVLRTALLYPEGRQVAQLAADLDDSSTTVDLGTSGLDAQMVYIGREAIFLGADSGGGVYTSCARGALGTTAAEHLAGVGQIDDAYANWWPRQGRTVTLYAVPHTAAGYGDLVAVCQWVLLTTRRRGPTLEMICGAQLQLLRELTLYPSRWVADFTRQVNGAPDQAYFRAWFRTAPPAVGEASRWPWGIDSLPSEGDQILVWWNGGVRRLTFSHAFGDNVAATFWYIDLLQEAQGLPGSESLDFEELQQSKGDAQAWQVFVSDAGAPDPSRVGGADPTFASVIYELLTAQWAGARLPAHVLDAASFDRIAEGLGADAACPRFFVGLGNERPKVLQVIEQQLLAPWQAALVPSPDGLRLVRLADSDLPGAVVTAISETQTLSGFGEDTGEEDLVDQVDWRYNRGVDGETTPLQINDLEAQGLYLGAGRSASVNAGAVADVGQAVRLGQAWAQRYRVVVPRARFGLPGGLPGFALLLPGDPLSLTSTVGLSSLSGAAVVEGCTSSRAVVEEVTWALDAGTQQVSALRLGYLYQRQRKIAPALRCSSWNAGTKVLTVVANHFIPAGQPVGAYTQDTDPFTVGDVVALVARDGAVRGTATITATTATTVTLPALGVTPASTDYLVPDEYDNQTTAQRSTWASLANTSNVIPTVGDPGHEYEA